MSAGTETPSFLPNMAAASLVYQYISFSGLGQLSPLSVDSNLARSIQQAIWCAILTIEHQQAIVHSKGHNCARR